MDPSFTPPDTGAGTRATFARNLTALYGIRLGASVLPLVSIPYVVRVLGPGGYGIFAFAQGLIGYFNMLIDYGFNLAATRRIAASREDPAARDRVVAATLAAKVLLSAIGFGILLALTWAVPQLRSHRAVPLLLYGQVVGNTLFPLWLFQGEERMVGSSAIMLGGMAAATAAIFVVVNDPGDYVALAGLWGTVGLLTGIIALVSGLRLFGVRLRRPRLAEIGHTLRDGASLSISAGSTTLYTSGNAFLLGLVAPREVVGFYAAGEKLARAVQELVNPIQQALYPRIAAMVGRSRALAVAAARRAIGWTAGLGLALSLALFVSAPVVVHLVLGPEFEPTVRVVRVLAALPFLVALSSTLTFQLMLPLGLDRALLRIITAAGLTNIALALLLASRLHELGMALAVLTTEVFVTAAVALYLRGRGVRVLGRTPVTEPLHPVGVAVDDR